MTTDFEGHEGRECGDHRTVGYRAWCFNCTEWCYPKVPCAGCERPVLVAAVEAWWAWYEGKPATSLTDAVLPPMEAARAMLTHGVFLGIEYALSTSSHSAPKTP